MMYPLSVMSHNPVHAVWWLRDKIIMAKASHIALDRLGKDVLEQPPSLF